MKEKIFIYNNIPQLISNWKANDEKVVFTNGCFDIIHLGHIDYLSKAAELGTKLIIGVNTDNSVSRLKGPHRPLQDEISRLTILASMEFVSAVVLFDQDTPLDLIQMCKPDVLVKGADYQIHEIVGAEFVLSYGGAVERLKYLEGYSTTQIENKIKMSCE